MNAALLAIAGAGVWLAGCGGQVGASTGQVIPGGVAGSAGVGGSVGVGGLGGASSGGASAAGGTSGNGGSGGLGGTGGAGAKGGAGGSGAGGPGGAAGNGGSSAEFASCFDKGPGRGPNCGVEGTLDCCSSNPLPGGSFERHFWTTDPSPGAPATLSPFRLDMFQVTVGRFRAFVEAYPQSRPSIGAGALPGVAASGWLATWDSVLPATKDALRASLVCNPVASTKPPKGVWTESPGANENAPMNCFPAVLAEAFCIWDGGRLPTLAEWQYAAFGGDEQRTFPWGADAPDPTRAILTYPEGLPLQGAYTPVGMLPLGEGRWHHRDLLGGRLEWLLDVADNITSTTLPLPCLDCAWTQSPTKNLDKFDDRMVGGRAFGFVPPDGSDQMEALRVFEGDGSGGGYPGPPSDLQGLRCARRP